MAVIILGDDVDGVPQFRDITKSSQLLSGSFVHPVETDQSFPWVFMEQGRHEWLRGRFHTVRTGLYHLFNFAKYCRTE